MLFLSSNKSHGTNRKEKTGAFDVSEGNRLDFNVIQTERNKDALPYITIDRALQTIFKQMRATGRRPRTISSYEFIFNDFTSKTGVKYVQEITTDTIYDYMDMLEVALSTKLIRLKSIKAVLSRFFDNGWIQYKFWTHIQIRIDKEVKEGADETDIAILLNVIDKTTFTGFRDAVAILLMYRTGIRITTLGNLRNKHFDFDNMEINLEGSIQKGRSLLRLPMDQQLSDHVQLLIEQNNKVRDFYGKKNDFIFITQKGGSINNTKSNSTTLTKQINKYANKYGIKNVNAHAIRRAYAKNLLKQGANIALISKALGHQDLSTTTQYLHLDIQEVSDNLRDYL